MEWFDCKTDLHPKALGFETFHERLKEDLHNG